MRNHIVIKRESNIPLIGVSVFGIIDRGTNLLQVRPISGCPLNCIYCSVDEGPFSRKRNSYEVEVDYLLSEFNKVVDYKGVDDIEAHIDGIGEPLLYKDIVKLVEGIRSNEHVRTISMQTNGVLLNEGLIKRLAKAGIDRINLSINSVNSNVARLMSGVEWYDLDKVWQMAKFIVENGIDLIIAPVLIKGYNLDNVVDLIKKANSIGANLGIQKYERYKHGRRLKAKVQSWKEFYSMLRKLEKETKSNLILTKDSFNIHKCRSIPIVFKKGEKVKVKIVLPGWLSNEMIGTARDRLITVFNSNDKVGDKVNCKIVKTKHNLYLADRIFKY